MPRPDADKPVASIPRPPGFFECRRAIESLTRFQNLARHHFPMQPDIQFAPSLEELLPAGTSQQQQRWVLEQQINRLIPIVIIHLRRVGLDSTVSEERWQEKDYLGHELEKVTGKLNLVGEYLEMMRRRNGLEGHLMLMALLEQALGLYEARKKAAFRAIFNPLNWIAGLVRIPITVLERAGIEEGSSWMLKAYAWILRTAVLLLVVVGVARLAGVPIPWKVFLEHIR